MYYSRNERNKLKKKKNEFDVIIIMRLTILLYTIRMYICTDCTYLMICTWGKAKFQKQ
jgi:hypothetical protein